MSSPCGAVWPENACTHHHEPRETQPLWALSRGRAAGGSDDKGAVPGFKHTLEMSWEQGGQEGVHLVVVLAPAMRATVEEVGAHAPGSLRLPRPCLAPIPAGSAGRTTATVLSFRWPKTETREDDSASKVITGSAKRLEKECRCCEALLGVKGSFHVPTENRSPAGRREPSPEAVPPLSLHSSAPEDSAKEERTWEWGRPRDFSAGKLGTAGSPFPSVQFSCSLQLKNCAAVASPPTSKWPDRDSESGPKVGQRRTGLQTSSGLQPSSLGTAAGVQGCGRGSMCR